MLATVTALYSYPIKGLSAHSFEQVSLNAGEAFPFDRLFALARADGDYDVEQPRRASKSNFLQLVRNERLAGVQTDLDEATWVLTVRVKGHLVHRADLSTSEGRQATATFFGRMAEVPTPHVVSAPGLRFTDEAETSEDFMRAISLINVSSVAALSQRIGKPLDPLRFRANIYVEGWPPFSELDALEREVELGACRLQILKRTERCAATEVNPSDARRDIPVPRLLMQHFGHSCMGVYVSVTGSGGVARGDRAVLM